MQFGSGQVEWGCLSGGVVYGPIYYGPSRVKERVDRGDVYASTNEYHSHNRK